MNSSFFQLILIRFKEFAREPGVVFWSVIFPISMAWVLGVAFSKKGELVQTIAIVRNNSMPNKLFQDFLSGSEPLTDNATGDTTGYRKEVVNDKLGKSVYRFIPASWDSAILMVKRGQTAVMIKESEDSLFYYFDPKSPEAKLSYIMLSSAINHEDFIYETASIRPLITVGTRYIDYLVPGLIAIGIMNSILWGISYTLIDMRSRKLLRRMIATPMKKSHFLFSHFASRLSLTIIEASILITFSWFYFRLSVQGSVAALIMMFLAGNICFTGIAVLISCRTSNSNIGNGLINFVSMPMMILSGIFFSYHNFPDFVVPFIQKLPLTVLADSIRGIFIEGSGVKDILPEFIALSAIGLLLSYIGLRVFKWY
jgi:ABC-2 type transport system permease protein